MRHASRLAILLSVAMLLAVRLSAAEPATSLLRDGERWVFLGDSITAMDSYPQVVARAFRHWHPEATLTVVNSGVAGDTASADPAKLEQRVLRHKPTVVSVMYGMNEAINVWRPGREPREAVQARYRAALTAIVRAARGAGATVLLMSPTTTDPAARSFFTIDRTVPFLRECAAIMREVAQAEGAVYVPVQEAYLAAEEANPGGGFTPDGVHPAAPGQYVIARALWEACGLALPLAPAGAPRTAGAVQPPPAAGLTLALASRFIAPDAAEIALTVTAATAQQARLTWSFDNRRGSRVVDLVAGANTVAIPLAPGNLPSRDGQAGLLLVDLRVGEADAIALIDLCRTRVLHLVDDRAGGTVESAKDRPEGRRMATWQAQRVGDALRLSFEVFDSELKTDGDWPFAKDGLNLMLDYRPTARFAGSGIDREVTQLFLTAREQPFFAVGVRAWTGRGMDLAASAAGARTATGYTVDLLVGDKFDLHTPSALSSRDYVGLLVAVDDADKGGLDIVANQQNDKAVNLYANNLLIIDLKNRLTGDAVVNAELTSGSAPAP